MLKRIATHCGAFHVDEVLACALLSKLREFQGAQIIRTRDQSVLDSCDVVCDVGGVFDAANLRFDHHQRTFDHTLGSLLNKKYTTRLSSVGLIWAHFGHRFLEEVCAVPKSDSSSEVLFDKVYGQFIEELDAQDNGVSQYDGEPRYNISTTLGHRISLLNASWNEDCSEPRQLELFHSAMTLAYSDFIQRVDGLKNAWLPAKRHVQNAFENRYSVHSSGRIVCLESTAVPWKSHLLEIEEEQGHVGEVLFVVFQDIADKRWRVQCVPDRLNSFGFRLGLLNSWRGLSNDELITKSGIDDCIFCHASGHIGGNHTMEGAVKMAVLSIE